MIADIPKRTCSRCTHWDRSWMRPVIGGMLGAQCFALNQVRTGGEQCGQWQLYVAPQPAATIDEEDMAPTIIWRPASVPTPTPAAPAAPAAPASSTKRKGMVGVRLIRGVNGERVWVRV
jgi:hypothetical protein